ncbi:hypothetical protein ACINWC743_A0355 [Acinetobacter sp. WC-743]|nr:hypothetical protein ACINWC743_A0355 [Acinetobacter sp. WC-743]
MICRLSGLIIFNKTIFNISQNTLLKISTVPVVFEGLGSTIYTSLFKVNYKYKI